MIIEWLKFKINPAARETFIEKDNQTWTAAISKYPGFLGKEIWSESNSQEEIVIVIRWETLEHWKSIPQSALDKIEESFAKAMEGEPYQMVEASSFEAHKVY